MTIVACLAAPLSGALSPVSLVRVLRTLRGSRHTGILHLGRGSERLTLRFVDGHVVSGAQGPVGRLGDILIRCGRLDPGDLDPALEKAALEGRRLGPVLVDEHLVPREAVQEALRLQVRDVLFAALFWGFGAYRFEPDAGPTFEEEINLEISTAGLIFELVSSLDAPGTVLRGLVDLGRPVAAAAEAVARLRADRAPLGRADAYVLSRADGVTTVRQIVETAPLPAEDVERSLVALFCCDALLAQPTHERADPDETVALSSEERGLVKGRLAGLRRQDLEDTLRELSAKHHFEVLGVEVGASADELKQAYLRLARQYHPDTVRDPDLAEATKDVFLRISEAYNVLGSPDSRRRYQERQGLGARPLGGEERLAKQEPRADARPMIEPAEALTHAEGLIAEGKPFEAVALLEDVLPHAGGRLRTLARLLRARAFLKTASGARPAETELREVLQENPDCLEACLALGRLYRDHGLRRRAARQFSRVLEIAPGHPGATAELRTLPLGDAGGSRLRVAAR